MTEARKAALKRALFEEKILPVFPIPVDRISYEDGVKTYFKDGSWVICRFSGTEPLLRMAAEADDPNLAEGYIQAWRTLLAL